MNTSLRLSVLSAVLATAVMTTTALAADPQLSGFPTTILSGKTARAKMHPLPGPFGNTVTVNSTQIVFEKTTLEDIQKQFGGSIQTRGDSKIFLSWVCYNVPFGDHFSRVWFVSNGEADGPRHLLTMVSAEETKKKLATCSDGDPSLAAWKIPVPGLRQTSAELMKDFKASTNDGVIRYFHETSKDSAGGSSLQSLVYLLKGGDIAAVAFSKVGTK